MGFVAPLLLGLLVLLSLRQSRQPLTSRTWVLLRSLLPSWRFFEDVEPGPELRFCLSKDGSAGTWQPVLVPPARRGFFLNAEGNLYLAEQSLVEQLWSELDGVTLEAAPGLTSYRLVQRLIVERMQPNARYRFRLVSGDSVDFESEEHAP
ncbi:MAG: hypothetical protein EOO73_02600 [Myxococcales bacterium]|nr:MAG: hypothetical protein EOO73_02600 [Myxococcales bacterium]